MQCPKCYGDMANVLKGATIIDRCENCHGLYFDQLTRHILGSVLANVDVDTGHDEAGEYDEMVYVECPKCDRIMDQRMIEEPVRIRFELCPTCNATFLDAGEFRDYTSENHIEEFKALLPES